MSIDSKVEQMSKDVVLFPEDAARSFSGFTKSVSNYVFVNVYYYLNLYKRKLGELEQFAIHLPSKLDNTASELEKACIQFAIKLEKDQRIHALFGFLDGISVSSGTLGYIFSLIYFNSSKLATKNLHEWSVTPLGIALIILETLLMIALSIIGNYCKAKENDNSLTNLVKKWIIDYWSYARDILKAAKNSYKGFRNALQVIMLVSSAELTSLIMPVTIVLAVVTIAARVYIRMERNKQKKLNDGMEERFKKIKKAIGDKEVFDAAKIQNYRKEIRDKKNTLQPNYLFLSATVLNGFVDSLYLYIGVATIATLNPIALAIVLFFSVFYAVVCVISRLYEEYDKLRRFEACVAHIELMLLGKEFANETERLLEELNKTNIALSDANGLRQEQAKLHAEFHSSVTESQFKLLDRINEINLKLANFKEEVLRQDQEALCAKLKTYIKGFESKHKMLYARTVLSDFSALLEGVKNGLAGYGMLCAGLFALSAVFSVTVACPPALLFPILLYVSVGLGMLMMAYFVGRAVDDYSKHRNNVTGVINPREEGLSSLLKTLKETAQKTENISTMKPIDFESYIDLARIPENNVQACFENFRAGVSGASKSFKGWGFALTWLQTEDADGNYHDSSIATILGLIFMPLYMATLGLRAHAKGFGKKKATAEPDIFPAEQELIMISDKTNREEFEVQTNTSELERNSNLIPDKPSKPEKPKASPVIAKEDSSDSPVVRFTRSLSALFSDGFFSGLSKKAEESYSLHKSKTFFGAR